MSERIGTVTGFIEQLAPPALAASWDNCGLMTGDPDVETQRVLFALDCTAAVIREALDRDCRMIVTHHPLIFEPLKHLSLTNPKNKLLVSLVQQGTAVYSAHTSFDFAARGVSHVLAERMGLMEPTVLQPADAGLVKLLFTVPEEQAEAVCQAVFGAGAGTLGDYTQTRFTVSGQGSFVPQTGADPFIGSPGRRETVSELKVETVLEKQQIPSVVSALLEAHPYEEPAYDLVPLLNRDLRTGAGVIGLVEEPESLDAYAARVRDRLGLDRVTVYGDRNRTVRKVAMCGGSGKSLIGDALKAGADVLVTGDIGYHDGLDAPAEGLCLIDAGHAGTEWPAMEWLCHQVANALDVEGIVSEAQSPEFGI